MIGWVGYRNVVCVFVCVHVRASMHAQSYQILCDPRRCSLPGPLALGFFRKENCSRLPFPPPGDLPNPGIEPVFPVSPALHANCLLIEPSGKLAFSTFSFQKEGAWWFGTSPVKNLVGGVQAGAGAWPGPPGTAVAQSWSQHVGEAWPQFPARPSDKNSSYGYRMK